MTRIYENERGYIKNKREEGEGGRKSVKYIQRQFKLDYGQILVGENFISKLVFMFCNFQY